jgi:hypothetical protein
VQQKPNILVRLLDTPHVCSIPAGCAAFAFNHRIRREITQQMLA